MKKILMLSILCISVLLFFSCSWFNVPTYESWDHVVSADNYSLDGTTYTYTYVDERFNQTDWFDVYLDNDYWEDGAGWGRLDSVYDWDTDQMYYQPLFYDGYVEWVTFSDTDIVGATLRFYRIKGE